MPLVIEAIGISASLRPGQTKDHILRATWPWSSETPLRPPDRRSARIAMLKVSPHGWRLRARLRKDSRSRPSWGQKAPKCLSINHSGNSSCPAGTPGGQEGGVPFVHVPDGRVVAERPQRPDAAHPEQHLLGKPSFQVAGIEVGGQLAVRRLIAGDVTVEQIQRHASDLDA